LTKAFFITGRLIMATYIGVRKSLILLCFLTGIVFFGSADAQAQQETKLDLKTTVEKELKVKKQGKTVLEKVPAENSSPGDQLVYTITYTNAGKGAVVDATIVNPIPRGVTVDPMGIEGTDANVTCSIDSGRSFHAPPVMVKIKKPDGSLESKPAPPESYTHIRWIIKKPLAPGQTGQVNFKATVK